MRLEHDTIVSLAWMVGLVALVGFCFVLTSGQEIEVSSTGHGIYGAFDTRSSANWTVYTGDNSTETAGGSNTGGSSDDHEGVGESSGREGEGGFIFKARPKWIEQEPVVVISSRELIEN